MPRVPQASSPPESEITCRLEVPAVRTAAFALKAHENDTPLPRCAHLGANWVRANASDENSDSHGFSFDSHEPSICRRERKAVPLLLLILAVYWGPVRRISAFL